jgi:hypothetical protein
MGLDLGRYSRGRLAMPQLVVKLSHCNPRLAEHEWTMSGRLVLAIRHNPYGYAES